MLSKEKPQATMEANPGGINLTVQGCIQERTGGLTTPTLRDIPSGLLPRYEAVVGWIYEK